MTNKTEIEEQRLKKLILSRAKKMRSGCVEWQGYINTNGYGTLNTKIDGKYRQYRAHRVSYLLYNGDLEAGKMICHHCDNRRCVKPSHLYQGTAKDNIRDSIDRGTHYIPKGEMHHNSKLTADDIRFIREDNGNTKQKDLAKMFNVHPTAIGQVMRGLTWKEN